MIEATICIFLLCLILFAALQVSLLYTAEDVVRHAAVSAARADTVGMNDFMVRKVTRVATIPNAGPLLWPEVQTSSADPERWQTASPGELLDEAIDADAPVSPQTQTELSRIPLYLGANYPGELRAILDYREWDTVGTPRISQTAPDLLEARVVQRYRLNMPLHRTFYGDDEVFLESEVTLDDHADLYLQ